jgi:hypothetical protein
MNRIANNDRSVTAAGIVQRNRDLLQTHLATGGRIAGAIEGQLKKIK